MLSDILMWNKVGRVVTLIAERLNISPERALDLFYPKSVIRNFCEQNVRQ